MLEGATVEVSQEVLELIEILTLVWYNNKFLINNLYINGST